MQDGAKTTIRYGDETKVKTVEDQGFWGPTIKTVYTYECVPEPGIIQTNVQDGKTYTCPGRYVAVQPQTAFQSGIAASTVVPVLVGAEQSAGFYFGMRDFGMKQNTNRITNNNDTDSSGGASINSNTNEPYAISNSGVTNNQGKRHR